MKQHISETIDVLYIKYSIIFYLTLIIVVGSLFLCGNLYNPDMQDALKIAQEQLLNPAGSKPEPKERTLFFCAVIGSLLSVTGFSLLLGKYFNKLVAKTSTVNTFHFLNILFISIILYQCFTAANPFSSEPQNIHDTIAKTNFDFYFIKSFLHKKTGFYFIFIFPILLVLVFFRFKKTPDIIKILNKYSSVFSILFSLCLSCLALFISSFKFPYTFENKFDFNAIFYSVVQVFNGHPMLVDGFTNTYGLYPHFISPLLKITGLSVLNFSLLMGLLLATCFVMIFFFIRKNIENHWFTIITFSLVFFQTYAYGKVATNFDPYFAIHPIRWLFPCLLLITSLIIHSDTINQKWSYLNKNVSFLGKMGRISVFRVVAYFIFSLGILWNPDFGIFCFISLIALFIFHDFDTNTIFQSITNAIIQIVLAFVCLGFGFTFYALIIKLTFGYLPDIMMLFTAIKSFSIVGYYMLPMPDTMHPWMVIAFIYLIGWIVSINHFLKNNKTRKTLGVFLLTILGTLSLVYYQGRSHNWNLFVTNFEAFILLGIFANELHKIYAKEKKMQPLLALIICLIGFAPFQILAGIEDFKTVVSSKKDKLTNRNEQIHVETTANTIKSLCKDKEEVFIVTADMYQSLYHCLSGTSSAINPGFIDILTNEQYENLINKLQSNNQKVFVEPAFYKPINTKILNTLGAFYALNLISGNPNLYYYNRLSEINYPIFKNDTSSLFYHDFFKKLDSNLNIFEGKTDAFTLQDNYSVELIFKPNNNVPSPLNQNSTIISKIDNENGFVIQKTNDLPNKFIFAGKNGGIDFDVVLNQWNYVAIDVNQNKIKVFVNGKIQKEVVLEKSITNSNSKLFVGSYNNQSNFFFGNIKELQISKEKITEENLKNNMESFLNFSQNEH